jgi:phage protein D
VDKGGVKSDSAFIQLDNRDKKLLVPSKGSKIEVWLGWKESGVSKMGLYVVDDVSLSGPPNMMAIRANAADMTGGLRAPKERSWHEVSIKDIVDKIAAEHKMTASVQSQIGGTQIEHEDQMESDMQFLVRVCSGYGAVAKFGDGAIIVAPHGEAKSVSGRSVSVSLDAAEVGRWEANLTKRTEYSSVQAWWWNKREGRNESVVIGAPGKSGPAMELKISYPRKDMAEAAARARVKALNSKIGTLSLSGVRGNTGLIAEAGLSVAGLHPEVDSMAWIITQATHILDGKGYLCNIQAEVKQ